MSSTTSQLSSNGFFMAQKKQNIGIGTLSQAWVSTDNYEHCKLDISGCNNQQTKDIPVDRD